MSVQDLRDVLRERAEGPAPANPARHEHIRRRVRRTRRRRGLTAAAAAVAAAVTVFSLLPGDAAPPQEAATSAVKAARELPERFTARDGTGYRRLATATVRTEKTTKASVTIPVSGKPLDVAALCEGGPRAKPPAISVTGGDAVASRSFSPCPKDMELVPLVVPGGAGQVTVTFDTATRGWGCVRKSKDGPCVTQKPDQAVWSLAVYEWTPPDRPVEPGPLKPFPKRLARWDLAAATRQLVWPQDRTFTVTPGGDGGRIGIEALCAGDLAPRMRFTYLIEGGEGGEVTATCGQWESGPYPMAMNEFRVPAGKPVKVTVRAGIMGPDTNRPVRWSVAVYRKG
ncbi:hypothetical protein ACFFV7_00825 [Nonomuraea spiralis]|uniref:Uncharacterized protein n=1 Tax=Nonomuraea spiralis TaxID=46182 RepID=A0ABV5I5B0_9ACTN|nr:hypothetical protein [Nonomuraea spiralis]